MNPLTRRTLVAALAETEADAVIVLTIRHSQLQSVHSSEYQLHAAQCSDPTGRTAELERALVEKLEQYSAYRRMFGT